MLPLTEENKKRRDALIGICAAAAAYALLFACGITCPIKWFTGISCPGCGMTRAWLSALRLDFAAAFAYHPLFWLLPFALTAFALRGRMSKRLREGCAWAFCLAMLAVYAVRMAAGGSDIVVFDPLNSAPAKLLRLLRTL